jgi:hypothetical protein
MDGKALDSMLSTTREEHVDRLSGQIRCIRRDPSRRFTTKAGAEPVLGMESAWLRSAPA